MDKCKGLIELLHKEIPDLKYEITRHKYFKSLEQKVDVGYKWAEMDFIENHLPLWAEGYKVCYCKHVCPYKQECIK
jgi:hypothetical protein